jgi:hypothetical protein
MSARERASPDSIASSPRNRMAASVRAAAATAAANCSVERSRLVASPGANSIPTSLPSSWRSAARAVTLSPGSPSKIQVPSCS